MNSKYYLPYFTHQELACRQTGQIILAAGFAEKLVALRSKFNCPMQLISTCRSKEYNRKIGGVPNSFHIYDYPRYGFTGCCAIDVATSDNTIKGNLISLAWQLGWSIGINKNFTHLDRRIDYTNLKQTIFLY
ncbi:MULTISPECIES: D-Ala-D-Ala carboxypeptidase family metallohydrolase [unclassified Candidatus Tisiphia]|uniref:D-Ala-D-Ala carboxypeptidase family metallohydrolase n=1 Tax=unclassified Candidatus Tisiphia TaxID=2996318 RepID=UPI00313B43BE